MSAVYERSDLSHAPHVLRSENAELGLPLKALFNPGLNLEISKLAEQLQAILEQENQKLEALPSHLEREIIV